MNELPETGTPRNISSLLEQNRNKMDDMRIELSEILNIIRGSNPDKVNARENPSCVLDDLTWQKEVLYEMFMQINEIKGLVN